MIVEVTTFKLAADEASFLDADARVQVEFFHAQRGLVRRTTSRSADGEWLALVLWRSMHDAETAAEAAKSDPVARAFSELVDPDTVRTKRYTSLD